MGVMSVLLLAASCINCSEGRNEVFETRVVDLAESYNRSRTNLKRFNSLKHVEVCKSADYDLFSHSFLHSVTKYLLRYHSPSRTTNYVVWNSGCEKPWS